MDIKAMADSLVEKIKADPKMFTEFRENPVPVVEAIVGRDLPDDQILKVAELVKAKIDMDKLGSALGGLFKR